MDWTGLVRDLNVYIRRASEARAGPVAPAVPRKVGGRALAAHAIDPARRWCETLEEAGECVGGGGPPADQTRAQNGFCLHGADLQILNALAQRHPVAMHPYDLAERSRLSRGPIGKRLRTVIDRALVCLKLLECISDL